MPIKVKDVGTVSAKWTARAQAAVNDYKAGVLSPKQSQSQSAIAAAPLWQQAVTSAAALSAFQAGLRAAGDAGWQAGATGKGAARYPGGIAAGVQKFSTNIQPFLQAIAGLTLPAKGLRGSAQNIQRVAAVAAALHTLKLQRHGATGGP